MTEHLPECPVERMLRRGKTVGSQTCICDALQACEERVTAAAVQRVEALPWTSETWLAHAERAAIITAIKGDQP